MGNAINYAEVYSNQLRELYGQESVSDPLYHSNEDIQIMQQYAREAAFDRLV